MDVVELQKLQTQTKANDLMAEVAAAFHSYSNGEMEATELWSQIPNLIRVSVCFKLLICIDGKEACLDKRINTITEMLIQDWDLKEINGLMTELGVMYKSCRMAKEV